MTEPNEEPIEVESFGVVVCALEHDGEEGDGQSHGCGETCAIASGQRIRSVSLFSRFLPLM